VNAKLGEVVVVPGAGDGPALGIVAGEGSARAVVWPGMGAQLRSMHRISLGPGARTIELRHPSDAVYYVIFGSGAAVDRTSGGRDALVEGSMVHVDAGTPYELAAAGDGMELVGGPCPADASLYEGTGA
jgi:quercetin dioxygenase-like cupin family protein